MRVALVRHPPALVAAGVCYGRNDLALAPDDGMALATIRAALGAFGGVVWSSPARRCQEIAAGLTPSPRLDDRLLELDFGEWEGRAWDDLPRAALDRWAADPLGFAAPGGESGAALVTRVTAFHAAIHDGGDCVVVAHGGPLRVLGALLCGHPVDLFAPSPPLGSVTWIVPAG